MVAERKQLYEWSHLIAESSDYTSDDESDSSSDGVNHSPLSPVRFSAKLLPLRTEQTVAAIVRRRQAVCMWLQPSKVQRRGTNRVEPIFCWHDHIRRLSAKSFKLRYRLDIDAFYKLLSIIWDDLLVDGGMAMRRRNGLLISPQVRLAVSLRYFAGGDTLDLMLIYSLSRGEVYSCIWTVMDSINARLKLEFPALDDIEALRAISDGFQEHLRQKVWRGQVSAIDGVHIAMRSPGVSVVDQKSYYVPRKAEFALLCIAVCDQRRRFIYYDISSAPTTHDSMAWANSDLGQKILAGQLPPEFFFNGDAAFSLSNSLLTPSGG
eukprot:4046100-Pleurochrysis_carterae.AAC.1